MAQSTTGLHAILSSPTVYNLVQIAMGARPVREAFVNIHVRPFPGARILDFGCGPADILDHLPPDVDYVGYDISPQYIARARKRYGGRGEFHCARLTRERLTGHGPFDRILANGVLHHLNDDEASEFFAIARAALARDGMVVTMDPTLTEPQNPVARFLISRDRGQNVRSPVAYETLAKQVFPVVRATTVHRVWIPYTHTIMEMGA